MTEPLLYIARVQGQGLGSDLVSCMIQVPNHTLACSLKQGDGLIHGFDDITIERASIHALIASITC